MDSQVLEDGQRLHELKNAFFQDFIALVNRYRAAVPDERVAALETILQDISATYGIDDQTVWPSPIKLYLDKLEDSEIVFSVADTLVLHGVAASKRYKVIGTESGRSDNAVKNTVRRLAKKLGVHGKSGLAVWAAAHGF